MYQALDTRTFYRRQIILSVTAVLTADDNQKGNKLFWVLFYFVCIFVCMCVFVFCCVVFQEAFLKVKTVFGVNEFVFWPIVFNKQRRFSGYWLCYSARVNIM